MSADLDILNRLFSVIEDRKRNRPASSYTTELLDAGAGRIAAKIREEASEVAEAAGEDGPAGRDHLVREAADLVYHLLVLLACCDVQLAELTTELAGREGTSGLAEKASREEPS